MDWRDLPTLAALRAFEAAARAGSLSAAARELNVTHAAIAQHVRTVEDHLGQSLLIRQGRGMQLTEAGVGLSRDLSDGFATVIAGVRRAASAKNNQPLHVSVTPSFAENWLMPRLADFWNRHPEITISFTPDNTVVDLRRDGFDVGIRYGDGNWPGLQSTFLASGDYVIVAAPALLRGRKPKSIADMLDVPWLFEKVHQVHRRWAEDNGLDLACCQMKELATLAMVLSAVRSGSGASVISRALIADDLAAGRLVAITEEKQDGIGYHIVTLPGVPSAKVKTFIKWLKSQA